VTFAILTFGCRVNQADSFDVEQALRARGATPAPPERADLLVVNTCTVTGAADQGARQSIRRIVRANPAVRVIVTGCYATRTPDILAGLPNVIHVVPNDRKDTLAEVLDTCVPVTTAERFGEGDGACRQPQPGTMGRTAYPLRVQTGCDEQCAYCIIPSTRGHSRSRPMAEVLDEVRRLGAAGYRELWLVGVHLGSYGRDLPEQRSLPGLLRLLDRLPGDITFRISSLEPMDCPDDVVDLVARSGRFAPHFHLPLQHTSDRVLMAMRRPYTFETYQRLAATIRERIPHAFLGTDLIVGFPGETDDDAEHAARELPSLPLSALHVFPYSDRPGTVAEGLIPKVAPSVMAERARVLREIGATLHHRFLQAVAGTTRSGLTLDDGETVLTDNYVKVRIPKGLARNVRVRVHIDEVRPEVRGTLVG
jgi:threonylcarbamoyladenosine tRNA methylthiotransferase MtaB